MEQRRNGVKTGSPDNDASQDRVNVTHRLPDVMGLRQQSPEIPGAQKRERMPFQPSSDDRSQRDGDQQGIERNVGELGGILHPRFHRRSFRGGVDRAP